MNDDAIEATRHARLSLMDARNTLRRTANRADPIQMLEHLQGAFDQLEQAERELVAAARTAGRTWASIGLVYGVTPQAVQHRFGGGSQ